MTDCQHDHSAFVGPWGVDDQMGAGNRITPASRLAALSLVNDGEVVDLGQVIEMDAPRMPPRQTAYFMTLSTRSPGSVRNLRKAGVENDLGANLERIEMTTHVGTHIDALGHMTVGDRMYNGISAEDTVGDFGLSRLGVENVPPMITRGVLLDVSGLDGGEHLEAGRALTPDDLERAQEAAGAEVREGDVVCLNTGWGRYFMTDNAKYTAGEPGLDVEAAEWLTSRGVIAIAADNMAVEVIPHPRFPKVILPVHQHVLVENGVYLIENIKLDELTARGKNEFCFLSLSAKFKGATGCPIRPIAMF